MTRVVHPAGSYSEQPDESWFLLMAPPVATGARDPRGSPSLKLFPPHTNTPNGEPNRHQTGRQPG